MSVCRRSRNSAAMRSAFCRGSSSATSFISKFHHGDTEDMEKKEIVVPAKAGTHSSAARWSMVGSGFSPGRQVWFSSSVSSVPPCDPLLLPPAQFAADDLAGGGQRQFRDKDDVARRLIPGEAPADKGADLLGEFRS